ncbi:MAG: FtsX-like permease family protein [Bdellovibrionota bacterium]
MIKIIFKSILNRKLSFFLTLFSIAMSIALFVGVERVRLGAQESFTNTISQTDLVVGARGSGLQLLLYTVFHIGNATNNISWSTYTRFAKRSDVAWTIPYSLGDSYKGFRVVATNENFYEHYRFLQDKKPQLVLGHQSLELFDVTLGSAVAQKENLKIGDKIALTHGVSNGPGIMNHTDKPFTVVGILQNTGTPLDRALYITLEGMEAIHIDWKDGAPPLPGQGTSASTLKKENIKIKQLTSFLLGATSRIDALSLQRKINNYKPEPLMAIIPGVTLSELWQSVSYVEVALKIVTLAVVVVGLIGMMVAIFNSLESRRREIAILRAIGAGMKNIFVVLIAESFILSFFGCVCGVLLCYVILILVRPMVLNNFGIDISIIFLQPYEYLYLSFVVVLACVLGLVPGYKAYKNCLVDGLSSRV